MQDRYAGDVGDFVKLGLLRALSLGRRLGVAWYRFPDEDHNKDGRHVSYLASPARYGSLDRLLFDYLKEVVVDARSISSLLPLLGDAVSSDECLDVAGISANQRRPWRREWFARVLADLSGCDLVFADPDNGIVDNSERRKGSVKFGKQIPIGEVRALAQGRCAVIYHHNTRRRGGHDAEVEYWLQEFGMPALAVRATAYSPRTFFILNPDPIIEERVHSFCNRWRDLRVRVHGAAYRQETLVDFPNAISAKSASGG
ncbi:hypothetical protein LZA78_08030 [Sinirhodobacter sp. WL0062]|uniref:Uncharacterized protein n=1 Tax=Rhodobacter flavimaris TaxID=2907145 RepID=A0ABS8YU93_9RHOB|nr:hypothetical protein [Sinirhodobacter sp. WL0062]MCE5973424.1 hypothetical protein [Sinirhodobacter sp. WL0062]